LTVQNGSSAGQGGCIDAGQSLTLMRVRVQGCRTTLAGGGVSAVGTLAFPSVLSITDTTIAQNVSTGPGAGLDLSGQGGGGLTATISRSTISGNVAATFGGGIRATQGTI